MWGMNISRSKDKTCYEIAHKLGINDIIDSQYSTDIKFMILKQNYVKLKNKNGLKNCIKIEIYQMVTSYF